MEKCEQGYRLNDGKCVEDKFFVGVTKDDKLQIKKLLSATVVGIFTWSIFYGIMNFFKLNQIHPLFLIIIGLIGAILTYRFGLKKN